ncbi:Bug family tripartite tricarboxylate transporter substrate binding protein [Giesbergeria anulus]|nr:tripartite tricarboxylate transporter substrate-binding protein [Giesbergeria anulus]
MSSCLLHRRTVLVGALAASVGGSTTAALAQSVASPAMPDWPTRPIKIIVGFPGGSSPDLVARTLAEPLAQALGQPVIVENRVGAGGNIAAQAVAHATDHHTLGVMINGNMTIARLLNPQLGYDPIQDLAPVSLIGMAPLALAVPANAPGAGAVGFFASARQARDAWNYGTPGVGTVAHIGMELLKAKTGMAPVHVPYPGNPQVIQALIAGQIQLALLPPAMAAAQERAGKLRVIGISSLGRSTLVPHSPSLAEVGVPGFELEIWNALAAPRSLPAPVLRRLSVLCSQIVRNSHVREKLFHQGWQVAGTGAEGLARRIAADTRLFGGVIASAGIRIE